MRIVLSKGQHNWIYNEVMYALGYEDDPYYKPLMIELEAGRAISQGIEALITQLESVIDRVNHGDRDREAYRDKAYAQRIYKKIQ